jgi:hypothetical protein
MGAFIVTSPSTFHVSSHHRYFREPGLSCELSAFFEDDLEQELKVLAPNEEVQDHQSKHLQASYRISASMNTKTNGFKTAAIKRSCIF